MNFMKCIGDHMNGSGVHEIWVESDLLGPIAAEQVLSGKHYNRGMPAHKMTSQALWRLLLPPLLGFLKDSDREIYDEIIAIKTDHVSIELAVECCRLMQYDRSLVFWMSYLDMVSTLLMFTRGERDGIWDLYLYAFRCMLPWFFRYDHTNYARWGAVYLADATQLPAEILQECRAGNFVVKQFNARYNQVDPDQSQEWLNATGKKGGGIVGITRTPIALSR